MGMGAVGLFDDKAKLTGVLESHDDTHVSKILHKAFIKFDEDANEDDSDTESK